MSFWGWITGNSEAETAQAANVARQWQTLLDNAASLPADNYATYYRTLRDAYGPPPPAVQTALDAARAANAAGLPAPAPDYYALLNAAAADHYADLYANAAADGFVDGVKTAPAILAGAAGGTLGGLWNGLPSWLKIAALAGLGLYALHTLARLGVRLPPPAPRRRKSA
jgi:hypothetical protein